MSIAKGYVKNFETLKKAGQNGDLCLVDCQRVSDNTLVVLLCAAQTEQGVTTFVPFAEMIGGNPYELYRPPAQQGEVYEEDK